MKRDTIKYSKGYKYYLREDYTIYIPVYPSEFIDCEFFSITTKGELCIYRKYAWNGASGPTIDTKSTMRGSLVHDVGYQMLRLIRSGVIQLDHTEELLDGWRKIFDRLLHNICEEDGMWKIRAGVWWRAVEWFAGDSAEPDAEPKILEAP